MKKLISMALMALAIGCGSEIPDVKGTYDQTSLTAACNGFFDKLIEVVQDGENIILQAKTAGYVDATGTIDANGTYEVDGAFSDGTSFTCTGTIINDIASGQCQAGAVTCSVTYEKR